MHFTAWDVSFKLSLIVRRSYAGGRRYLGKHDDLDRATIDRVISVITLSRYGKRHFIGNFTADRNIQRIPAAKSADRDPTFPYYYDRCRDNYFRASFRSTGSRASRLAAYVYDTT